MRRLIDRRCDDRYLRPVPLLALLAVLVPGPVVAAIEAGPVSVTGGARAYFESAYISSTGNFSYTKPVAEQTFFLKAATEDFGYIFMDGWTISALNDQSQQSHRRAFSCYEGTLQYGYLMKAADGLAFETRGGLLWDWLGGYRTYAGIPLAWYANESVYTPWAELYANGLGLFEAGTRYTRIRFGLARVFRPFESLTLRPYLETTWGSPNRFRRNYGGDPEDKILGGSFMQLMPGVTVTWYFTENFYLWGRYKHLFVIDHEARRLVRKRGRETDRVDYPFFGLGVGFSF